MKKIVFATGNAGKMKEIREILADLPVEIYSMKEAGISVEIDENGKTFEENAKIKAQTVAGCTDGDTTIFERHIAKRTAHAHNKTFKVNVAYFCDIAGRILLPECGAVTECRNAHINQLREICKFSDAVICQNKNLLIQDSAEQLLDCGELDAHAKNLKRCFELT